ncbi:MULTISPECIES: NlpC/P60 family peptidoglycan-binding protein RipD [Mycolicibacter]|uniref:NlpC/P60 family protein n=1 Tax=Mycolicibacter virginiensis TaxID=1795032 RepID=A0A9X7NXC5_9MYCO|nr:MULTISPECIES: NlpC/P60 family peptidoglycan-binding protein RipD [Mycobacteriaceae]OBG34090.1 hydrolase [Mycolicibacter heraklionensis]OBJ29669.1 hydrolase [Mycolicibacter heraklionensis]PQM50827.1 NlpC/P60 family protein [Mycolicibacter virginiensis]ULP45648.1 NlpC/P60 family peptidoglycan-binding protein RipD [Mycolicibacter virginiensis]
MKRVCATAIALAAALAPALTTAPASADPLSQTGQNQLVERVIQRALSQRGVPFVYGGGDVNGPTNSARARAATTRSSLTDITGRASLPSAPSNPLLPGSVTPALPGASLVPTEEIPDTTTVGFDASGLIQYAFAGAGIRMPRTSGEQCSVGQKVPPAQARPGDLLCYGPGGTQSVALYLGNNQMIEGTSPAVAVSPARTSNMVPYLTRVLGS